MAFIDIEINNWSRFNPRRDYKQPTWFALNNRIVESPSMMELSDAEFRAWIYVLCQASQRNSSRVKAYFNHAQKICSISKKTMLSMIAKLEKDQSIQVHVQNGADDERDPNATDRQTNKQTDYSATDVALPPVASLWNTKTKTRPRVKHWNQDREKLLAKLKPQEDLWAEACEKVEASDFLSGRSGKWKACSFDWLLKPANFTKVIEGNYDNDKPAPKVVL